MTSVEQHTMDLWVRVTFRLAQRRDLPKLEWYGQYTHFRNVFIRAYREQLVGKRLMLVADLNDFPIGQVFIQVGDETPTSNSRAYLYAFRVMEMFRGQGIGTRMLYEAEALIMARGFRWATLAVARDNTGALRLYERNGYRIVREDEGDWNYVDHEGTVCYVHEPCWMLEKRLR